MNNVKIEEKFTPKGVSKGFTLTFKDSDGTNVKIQGIHGMSNVIKVLKTIKEDKGVK